jgi:uncharacterized membrane-anchored protein
MFRHPHHLPGGLLAVFIVMFLAVSLAQEPAKPQQSQPEPVRPKIDWQVGPTVGHLGDKAQIDIPKGYRFTGKEGAQQVLVLTHNVPNGSELGALIADARDANWFMIFEFRDTGYVKDDEKNSLDTDALLKSIREATEEGNEERQKRGWKPLHVTGWDKPPFYDPASHNLTWATRVKGDDPSSEGSVNHSIRLLGRRGTINVDLVASPDEYAASISDFNTLISGFSYNQGNRYSDFTPGDKVAKYGLAALIAGGAGAVALKTGLLAKLWKLIVVAFAAIAGFIKKIFRSIFGKEEKVEDPSKQAAIQG